jgi:uncharacterized protein (TIGR01777 family)
MTIVCAGASGFIGTALIRRLSGAGHEIVLLSRSAGLSDSGTVKTLEWDARSVGPWAGRLEGADAVINLTGEPLASKRWSASQKRIIAGSRWNSSAVLVEAIGRCSRRPNVLVSASAVGFYGDTGTNVVDERSPKGRGFLADVCSRWEEEAMKAGQYGVRVVLPRIGVVLGPGGGALGRMMLPFRLFAGGWLGSGSQAFPWVHRDDLIEALVSSLTVPLRGPVNVVSPELVTMKEFSKALGAALRRPCWAPVPAFVLKAALGEMATMLLEGQRVVPRALVDAGFQFRYRRLGEALSAVLAAVK